jgi:NADH-quinone oxidoreductase subunit L
MGAEAAMEAAASMAGDATLRWIVLWPLLGVLGTLLVPRRAFVRLWAPAMVGASLATALLAVRRLGQAPAGTVLVDQVYRWMDVGRLQVDVGLSLDALSSVMVLVITGVGFLIHVYSTGYMAEDRDVARYFAYLNLFTLAMLILVLADNLLLLFVGWEGVGLCSYLLIGFWYEKTENATAGKKAFVVNRVGDACFLLGLFTLFWALGSQGTWTLGFHDIARHVHALPSGVVTAACLLLFAGATGKSAQLPLYVWLPDAMAGPTPVSALIHAATMVTAGVYLLARMHFLYALAPLALDVVAVVGAATALMAATIALAQRDIKKVLAYSTVSQLGYMFIACGVGAYAAGVFHLMTHAFFKGLLFLGAGSVIHGMSGEQDLRKMGGLQARMPTTFATMLIGCLAIAGVPPLSGFFSKDHILLHAYERHPALWLAGVLGAALTACYMFRMFFLAFVGPSRAAPAVREHIHESPWSMTLPLVVLAMLAFGGGLVGLPDHWLWGNAFATYLAPVLGGGHGAAAAHGGHHAPAPPEGLLMLASLAAAASGITVAYRLFAARPATARRAQRFPVLGRWLADAYYVDSLYEAVFVRPVARVADFAARVFDPGVVDGLVNGAARAAGALGSGWGRLQTGNVQHYALSLLLGAAAIVMYYAAGWVG